MVFENDAIILYIIKLKETNIVPVKIHDGKAARRLLLSVVDMHRSFIQFQKRS